MQANALYFMTVQLLWSQAAKKNYIHWIYCTKQYTVQMFFNFHFFWDKENLLHFFWVLKWLFNYTVERRGVIKRLLITIRSLTRYVKLVKHSQIPQTSFLFHVPLKLVIRLQPTHLYDWDILLLSIGPGLCH